MESQGKRHTRKIYNKVTSEADKSLDSGIEDKAKEEQLCVSRPGVLYRLLAGLDADASSCHLYLPLDVVRRSQT